MKDNKRLILYLFINVIVSACTILTILWIWDPANRPASLQPGASSTGTTPVILASTGQVNQTQPVATAVQPTQIKEFPKGLIKIDKIVGAESAASEVVVITRQGSSEDQLDLTNWKLQDTNGNVFTFPNYILYKDGAVNIYTKAGVNTVIDLYWNKSESVWQHGETATLIDSLGTIQATYPIP
jgi:hypothetical protein